MTKRGSIIGIIDDKVVIRIREGIRSWIDAGHGKI